MSCSVLICGVLLRILMIGECLMCMLCVVSNVVFLLFGLIMFCVNYVVGF